MAAAQSSCDKIIHCVRGSCLNFSINETPYSLYLTIRKSFSKSTEENFSTPKNLSQSSDADLEILRKRLELSESANNSLKLNCEEAVSECETSFKRIEDLEKKVKEFEQKEKLKEADVKKKDDLIQVLKIEKVNAVKEISAVEIKVKELGKIIKAKDKELHDMKNENIKTSETLAKAKSEYSDLSAKVRKEEKNKKKIEKKNNVLPDHNEIFTCSVCDDKLESMDKLKSHVRIHHMQIKSVQTEENDDIKVDKKVQVKRSYFNSDKNTETSKENEMIQFVSYQCHYCAFNIGNEKHLKEHVNQCIGSHSPNFLQDPVLPRPKARSRGLPPPPDLSFKTTSFNPPIGFPPSKYSLTFPYTNPILSCLPACEQCGWKASCGTEMAQHMKSVHMDYRNPFDVFKQF